jgi:replication factor A1
MLYRQESKRGRPNGKDLSPADIQLLEYLAKVSMKYKVDSGKFLDSFLLAYRHRKSKCGKLSIECRVRERDSAIFLITKDREVVGQFRISEHLLYKKTSPLKEFICRLSSMRTLSQRNEVKNYKIGDLKVGMKNLNIIARVLEVSQPIQIVTRSGFYANLANALITDETGTINLSLLGSQMKEVTPHNVIRIENAHVAWFKGERQLRVGKNGRIGVINSTINSI